MMVSALGGLLSGTSTGSVTETINSLHVLGYSLVFGKSLFIRGKWTHYDCFINIWGILWNEAECGRFVLIS